MTELHLKGSLPLGSPSAWAFLAGSGISVPSGLPTAWEFNQRVAAFLGGSPAETSRIASFLATGSSSSKQALRFEQVIQILRDIGRDKDLRILDNFDDPGPPTELHFFLARMLLCGAVVVTTNFDSLIERAFLAAHDPGKAQRLLQIHMETARLFPRSTFEWYAKQRTLRPALLKLHGSLREVSGAEDPETAFRPIRARISIGATLDALGRASSVPGLEPQKDRVLRRAVRGRTLCVLGYSGSDDFDVLPSLAHLAPTITCIVWIRHATGRTRVYVMNRGELATRLPGALANASWAGQAYVIEGNTLRIIQSLFGKASTERAKLRTTASGARIALETLPPYSRMSVAGRLTVRGYLEEAAGALRAAGRTYARATEKASRRRDTRDLAFALTRLGHLARTRGSLSEAARYLRRSRKVLPRRITDHRLAATVYLAAGNVELDQTRWRTAAQMYRRAIAHSNRATWPRMEATALNNLGLVHRRQGRLGFAKRYILNALRIDRRLRDRTGMARDLGNLGAIAHEQEDYPEALRYGYEALALDRDMGNYATLTTKRVNVAFALIRLGQLREAEKELRIAFRLARRYTRLEDEARCWSARGLLLRERGQLHDCIRCHEKALSILRDVKRWENLAHEFVELGDAHQAAGNPPHARECFRKALRFFVRVHNTRMATVVARKLRAR